MTAHHTHNITFGIASEKLVKAVADGMIVQCPRQRLFYVLRGLAFLQVVTRHPPVETLLIRVGVADFIALIKTLGRVKLSAEVKEFAHVGKEKTILRLPLETLRQRATKEKAVAVAVSESELGLGCQI